MPSVFTTHLADLLGTPPAYPNAMASADRTFEEMWERTGELRNHLLEAVAGRSVGREAVANIVGEFEGIDGRGMLDHVYITLMRGGHKDARSVYDLSRWVNDAHHWANARTAGRAIGVALIPGQAAHLSPAIGTFSGPRQGDANAFVTSFEVQGPRIADLKAASPEAWRELRRIAARTEYFDLLRNPGLRSPDQLVSAVRMKAAEFGKEACKELAVQERRVQCQLSRGAVQALPGATMGALVQPVAARLVAGSLGVVLLQRFTGAAYDRLVTARHHESHSLQYALPRVISPQLQSPVET